MTVLSKNELAHSQYTNDIYQQCIELSSILIVILRRIIPESILKSVG